MRDLDPLIYIRTFPAEKFMPAIKMMAAHDCRWSCAARKVFYANACRLAMSGLECVIETELE